MSDRSLTLKQLLFEFAVMYRAERSGLIKMRGENDCLVKKLDELVSDSEIEQQVDQYCRMETPMSKPECPTCNDTGRVPCPDRPNLSGRTMSYRAACYADGGVCRIRDLEADWSDCTIPCPACRPGAKGERSCLNCGRFYEGEGKDGVCVDHDCRESIVEYPRWEPMPVPAHPDVPGDEGPAFPGGPFELWSWAEFFAKHPSHKETPEGFMGRAILATRDAALARVAELESQLTAERAKLERVRAECMKFYQQSGPIQHIVEMIDATPQPARPDVSKVYSTGWDGCDTDEEK